jgi:hypothetical protein
LQDTLKDLNNEPWIMNSIRSVHRYYLCMIIMSSTIMIACEDNSDAKKELENDTVNDMPLTTENDDLADQSSLPIDQLDMSSSNNVCVANPEQWTTIEPIVKTYCGSCHSTPTQFGAPFSLMTLQDWTPEHMALGVHELSQGSMPPAGQSVMLTQDRFTLIDWLSCGAIMESDVAIPAGGFESSHPILTAPSEPPSDTDFFEVRAQEFQVPVNKKDHYECFTVAAPVDQDRFIRRIETLVDDARVLHHIVLIPEAGNRPIGSHSSCDNDNAFKLVYGWAPGQGALHFEEGGIRLKPGQALTLQIHYNNSAQLTDAIDSSGVRIYHSPPTGPEVAVLTLGPLEFNIPARSRGEAVGYCELPKDTKLIASFPHMHELGTAFHQEIIREGAIRVNEEEENLIALSGWDFESQYIYETPLELNTNDLIRTTCLFENTSDQVIRFGSGTADEMCFNFAYISPPIDISFCNQKDPPQFDYIPGLCAPTEANEWNPPNIIATFSEPRPLPEESSTFLPAGNYFVDQAYVGTDLTLAERFNLDLEQSRVDVRGGSIWKELENNEEDPSQTSQEIYFDLNTKLQIVGSGLSFNRAFPISFAGHVKQGTEEAPTPLTFEKDCDSEIDINQIWIEVDANQQGAWLSFPFSFGPVELTISVHLQIQSL